MIALRTTRRLGDRAEEETTQGPSWQEVEAAVQALNGRERSELLLAQQADTTWLAIGGGEEGKYTLVIALRYRSRGGA
jgi:hypothetical protein